MTAASLLLRQVVCISFNKFFFLRETGVAVLQRFPNIFEGEPDVGEGKARRMEQAGSPFFDSVERAQINGHLARGVRSAEVGERRRLGRSRTTARRRAQAETRVRARRVASDQNRVAPRADVHALLSRAHVRIVL